MIPNTLSDGTLNDGRVGQNFSTTVAVNENKQTFEYVIEEKNTTNWEKSVKRFFDFKMICFKAAF